MYNPDQPSVICFGEVLFDLMPSGPAPGGAPMNVAIHLQNLGIATAMISRVGDDSLGAELIGFLKEKKVDVSFMQVGSGKDTGTVKVTLDQNDHPEYTIVENVAWDHIDDSFVSKNLAPDYVIHGTLACRTEKSRRSLHQLLSATSAKVVLDLNIREPFYSRKLVDELLKKAHIVKLNDSEFDLIKDWFHIEERTEEAVTRKLVSLYENLEVLIITRGAEGAVAWHEGSIMAVPAFPVEVKDTVGSGDAFLGGFLSRYIQGAALKEALTFAAATGAYVATRSGANPFYTEEDILKLIRKEIRD